jgi:hypothetical protein
LAPQCQQGAEISVSGYDDSLFLLGEYEYLLVRSALEIPITEMNTVMTGFGERC